MENDDLQEGLYLVEGLGSAPRSMPVWSADNSRHASGWQLVSVDLGMKNGRPLGILHFERAGRGDRVGISVRWDHVYDQLRCVMYEGHCDEADRERLERDARHRVGTWMAIIAEVGAVVASSPVARSTIFGAAHLLPEQPARVPD